jgi:hypothetical protein
MSKAERLRDRSCRRCRVDSIQGSLLGDYPELRPVEPWKFGHLFQYSRCGRQWFLHEHKQKIGRIQDDPQKPTSSWTGLRDVSRCFLEQALTVLAAAEP